MTSSYRSTISNTSLQTETANAGARKANRLSAMTFASLSARSRCVQEGFVAGFPGQYDLQPFVALTFERVPNDFDPTHFASIRHVVPPSAWRSRPTISTVRTSVMPSAAN